MPLIKEMTEAQLRNTIAYVKEFGLTAADRSRLAALRKELAKLQSTKPLGGK